MVSSLSTRDDVYENTSPPHLPTIFTIDGEIRRQYRGFNIAGTELTVRLVQRPDEDNPMSHFQARVTELFEYALRDCQDSDMVGLTIRNEVNVQDKLIGFSFRRKDQISENVIWSVFEKVLQCNARFNAVKRLVVVVHWVAMPVGFGRVAVKTKGRQLEVIAHPKRSIIEVRAEENCLAYVQIIAIARLKKDPNFDFFRRGCRSIIYFR